MTMKHISFNDSPVMRELERQAVKKGTFKAEPVVKTASVQKSFGPTQDLYADLIRLASGLRERGFDKEANALEDKLFIKKQAEAHLYRAIDEDGEDVINFAHPDGDAKVSDSQNQHGVVETILSQHKKMVDMANKQPSGKNARRVDNIILATASLLNVDLVKLAQESPDNSAEQRFELESSPEAKKKSAEVRALVESSKAKILEALNSAAKNLEYGQPVLAFNALLTIPGAVNFFTKYSKINSGAILQFLAGYKFMSGGKEELSAENINSVIYKMKSYGANYGIFKTYVGGLADKYFVSPNGNNEDQVKAIAPAGQAIYNYMVAQKTILIDNPLSMLNGTIAQAIEQLHNEIDSVANYVNKILPVNAQIGLALGGFIEASSYSKNIIKEVQAPLLNEAYAVTGNQKTLDSVKNDTSIADNGIDAVIAVLKNKNNQLNPDQDAIVDTSAVTENFRNISGILNKYIRVNKNKLPPKELASLKNNLQTSVKVYKALKDNAGQPFAVMLNSGIKEEFPGVNSIQDLEEKAQRGLELVDKYKDKGQQADDGLISQAEWDEGSGAKSTPSAAPGKSAPRAGAVPGRAPQGAGAPVSAQEKDIVEHMQQALIQLSSVLETNNHQAEASKLRNVGGAGGTADGIWAGKTTEALQIVKKLMNVNLVISKTGSVIRDAQNNYTILQQLISKNNGKGQTGGAVLDRLPRDVDFSGPPEAASFGEKTEGEEIKGPVDGNQILVQSNDLSSLSSFYNFLTTNDLNKQFSDREIGISVVYLGQVLDWFKRRAVFKFKATKDETYFRKVSALTAKYATLVAAWSKRPNKTNDLISSEDLQKWENHGESGVGGGRSGGGGSTYLQEAGGMGRKNRRNGGPPGSGGLEGTRTRVPLAGQNQEDNSPPITDLIDLSRGEWFSMPYDELDSPRLRLSDFQRVPGPRMAQAMFSNSNPEAASIQYQKFLNDLAKQLHDTFSAWAQNVSAEEDAAMKEYYTRWQQAIGKQYRDITQRRR